MTISKQSPASESLRRAIRHLKKDAISRQEAIDILEKSAALIKQKGLPPEVDYEVIATLLEAVLGEPLEAITSQVEVKAIISNEQPGEAVRLARGVDLRVTQANKLLAIELRPVRFAQGRRMMAFVGLGRGDRPDVAERHDDFLIEAYLSSSRPGPHGEG